MAKKDEKLKGMLKKYASLAAGPNAEKLIDILFKKKNVNEKTIAAKMGLTINEVRNLLYKLAAQHVVSFTRKKDKRRGGWYIYFWTIEERKSMEAYADMLRQELKKIDDNISKKKSDSHYHCDNCYLEFNEEGALLHDYTCPECGEVLQLKDVSKDIAKLEKEREQVKGEIALVEEEIERMESKRQREVEKREEEIKKQKEEERRKRRLKAKRKAAREARKQEKARAEKEARRKREGAKAREAKRAKRARRAKRAAGVKRAQTAKKSKAGQARRAKSARQSKRASQKGKKRTRESRKKSKSVGSTLRKLGRMIKRKSGRK
ncbi:hypothetical protein D6817_05465 [Candidatus Pacearchaeota archaeon]|nr:MAG: hypothetical protein D6817_05465 [Candidatus Pacearchaeota archaeon]